MQQTIYDLWGTVGGLAYTATTLLLIIGTIRTLPLAVEFLPKMFDGKNILMALLTGAIMFGLTCVGVLWFISTVMIMKQWGTETPVYNPGYLETFFGTGPRFLASVIAIILMVAAPFFIRRK